jgi:DNA-binding NarL/FixJ family response regulator
VTKRTTTVLVVDDHTMVAAGLTAILEDEPDLRVVGHADTASSAVTMAAALRPDVVMMDFRLPDARGADGVAAVLQASPDSAVLTVTASREDDALDAVVEAGAMGFVRKDAGADELVAAVRTVAAGGAHFSRAGVARLVRVGRGAGRQTLSPREVEVLQALADGASIGKIAGTLHLSHHTVRNHIRSAMGKLGVHTTLEAVIRAARAGFVDIRGEGESRGASRSASG